MIERNSSVINTALIELLLIFSTKLLKVVIKTKLQNIHFLSDVVIAINSEQWNTKYNIVKNLTSSLNQIH